MNPNVIALIDEHGIVEAGSQLGVAALLFSYKCTIACRHCGFGCVAERPDVRMDAAQAVQHLHALHELDRVIHIAGGECMMFWPELCQALRRADADGVAPHFIESNCSFAVDDPVTYRKLSFLRDHGVRGMLFSADPYHQAHVPPDSFIRARRIARKLFGEENVWAPNDPDERIREFAAIARDDARLREHVRQHPPLIVGTAYEALRHFLDDYRVDELPVTGGWQVPHTTHACFPDFRAESIWEIHIDPYDNILSNCGVILGNANETSPRKVLDDGPQHANWITKILSEKGPRGLAAYARDQHGLEIPERAYSKCSLCYEVRCFLRPFSPDLLGPAEIYGAPARETVDNVPH